MQPEAEQRLILEILNLADRRDVIVVGGQALAYWSDYLQVEIPSVLDAGITTDVDLLTTMGGVKVVASRLVERFGSDCKVSGWATLDDQPINLAKALVGTVEIDFLGTIHGRDATKRVFSRAMREPEQDGMVSRTIMHPMDCLRTRLDNLSLPAKNSPARLPKSLGQLRLAIDVVRMFVSVVDTVRAQLDYAEEVFEMACSPIGLQVAKAHGIDVMDAVPADDIPCAQFRETRWPQMMDYIRRRGLPKRLRRR